MTLRPCPAKVLREKCFNGDGYEFSVCGVRRSPGGCSTVRNTDPVTGTRNGLNSRTCFFQTLTVL